MIYEVKVMLTVTAKLNVEANTEEEARKKAYVQSEKLQRLLNANAQETLDVANLLDSLEKPQ